MENRLEFNYNINKDYEKLFNLVQKQRVICIVTYESKISEKKSIEIRDICASSVMTNENRIDIGCRGNGYISAFPFGDKSTKDDFLEQCEHYKLEFIDPDMVHKNNNVEN